MEAATLATMILADAFARHPRTVSFEFFPPRGERAWHTLEDTIEQLLPTGPDFVSVTYGAGGSNREKTRAVVTHLQRQGRAAVVAHLTCAQATVEDLARVLDSYAAAGVQAILALRGDPLQGQERFTPTPGGLAHADELITMIRRDGRFDCLCAAYPEGHPEAASQAEDWARLGGKLAAGALAAITQCFFDPGQYQALMSHMEAHLGRRPRIIPGILPVVDFHALERFLKRCGATVPQSLRDRLSPIADDPVAVRAAGMAWTVDLCRKLLDAGAPGLHFYCLNRSTAAAEILTVLRLDGHLGP